MLKHLSYIFIRIGSWLPLSIKIKLDLLVIPFHFYFIESTSRC